MSGGINRMDKPLSVDIGMGVGTGANAGGASVGVEKQLTPNIAVGADVASTSKGIGITAKATDYLWADKAFTPYGQLRLGADMGNSGGGFGVTPTVGARIGGEYRFDNGFSVGAYGGVNRAFGGTGGGSPWGAEAGVTVGIHF